MSCNIESQKILRQDAFKVNYDFYFKNNQGIFILQTNMKYIDLLKITKVRDLFETVNSNAEIPKIQ